MLRARGCQRSDVEAAALVLSELASNAVQHAGSCFSVHLTIEGATLRIGVEDGGPGADTAMPVRRAHGLGVVSALTRRWGVQATAAGKLVWAELSLHPARLGGRERDRRGRGRGLVRAELHGVLDGAVPK